MSRESEFFEAGDTFESRLRAEIEEETTARLVSSEYLFVVENRFRSHDHFVHSLGHYLLAEIDREDVQSREPHLSQHWLSLDELESCDLRPHVVRDAIASGEYSDIRHMVVAV